MSREKPRKPASSRAPVSRPRKIAGQAPDPAGPPVQEPVAEEPDAEVLPAEPAAPEDAGDAGDAEPQSALASPRTTRMLLVLAGILVVVLVLQGAWGIRHLVRDEPEPPSTDTAAIGVPGDQPVIASELAVQEGVQAAADAAKKIVGRTHQKYDEEVAAATELMTDEFAETYLETTDAVKQDFIANKTTVEVRVLGQGVVRANDTTLQALLFMNQYVIREGGKNPKTTRTPYRALLTMVNTDQGWLVDGIDTK